jgi:hypothetical protein
MTMGQVVLKEGVIAEMTVVQVTTPDAAATATSHEPLPPPVAVCPDDANASVTGEEDPGATLDMLDPGAVWSGRWCPWPKTFSA